MSARPEGPPALVVAALPEELAPLLRRLTVTADRVEGRKVLRTRATAPPLVLAATGDGASNAFRSVARLCDLYRPAALVGVGVAGALTASLRPLDLVASARLRNGAGAVPQADEILLRTAREAGAIPATLVTTDRPVVSGAGRSRLAPASGEPAAVDMESSAWARAAAGAGVPFVIVRAIADAADDELPPYLADCVGADGGVRRAAVVARALAHPASIPVLWRMRSRVAACAERLAAFLLDRYFVA
jgi:adenosylhomocysteine nucleosidase